MTYNGWINYETWATKLWMDDEEPSYRYWGEVTREILDDPPAGNEFITAERKAVHDLADRIKAEHQEFMPPLPSGIFSDLLDAAFQEVDWTEIAESLIERLAESLIRGANERTCNGHYPGEKCE